MHGMKWFFALLSLHESETCAFRLLSAITWILYASILFSHVEGQGKFLSIDCGSTSSSEFDNIRWVPDGTYISTGENAIVKDAEIPYDTLRYFPGNETKNCYVLPTKTNLSYLVRAGFVYGKYDNSTDTTLPTFELLFDATHWVTVGFSGVSDVTVYEMVVAAVSNSLSICLARTNQSSSIPFISSLEMRPLSSDQNMYSPVHTNHFLMTNSRINFGQSTSVSIRYPDDQFDRIWDSDSVVIGNISKYSIVSTKKNITSLPFDMPPSAVMQTARIANGSNNMTFEFRAKFGSGDYYLALYFAEFNSSAQRISDLYLDQVLVFQLNLSQSEVFNSIEILSPSFSVTGKSYNLVLKKNASSKSEPIINAAESYVVKKVELQTDDQDVRALSDVKTHFKLSVWNGDPCLPVSYKWSWLLCSISNVPRVTTLNLSGMDLKGEIPVSIANLTALTILDLHDNNLQGIIPSSFVNLPNLLKLDLRNNNLSGELPTFRSTVTINVSGNPFLCKPAGDRNCGVAPELTPSPSPSSSGKSLQKILVGTGITFAVTIIVLLAIYRWKFLGRKRFLMANSGHWPPIPPTTEFRRVADPVLSPRKESTNHLSEYTFTDIRAITNNFERELAGGCSGSVYYGVLPSGQEVVVKLLQSKYQRLQSEFQIMVERFCSVHHKNILSAIGYCDEYHRQLFVYEYMQKGTLYDQLHDQESLDWKTRLNILLQVAQGLEYLHFACSPSIIHGNVRSRNVLLNNSMVAKVSDFAFHELLPDGDKGAPDATLGYLDPEYFRLNKLTKESDVYSFGVLILEVVCGRIPFDTSLQKEQWNIVEWVRWTVQKGNNELVADPSLEGCYNSSSLSKVVQVAVQSVEAIATDRPTMSEIVMELKEAHKVEMGHHVAFAAPSSVDNDPSFSSSTDYDAKL